MNLRRQLLVASLMLLCLPWAGCQFLRETESTLRRSQAQALQATARAVATVIGQSTATMANGDRADLAQHLPPVAADAPAFYAHRADQPVIVDGYADGWPRLDYRRLAGDLQDPLFSVQYQAAVRLNRLYLMLHIRDPALVYSRPDDFEPGRYDHVILALGRDGRQRYRIQTAAPGSAEVHAAGGAGEHSPWRIHAYWQDVPQGYSVEIELPLDLTGGYFGFAVHDVDRPGGTTRTLSTLPNGRWAPVPRLVYPSERLADRLQTLAGPGTEMRILDNQGWVVADSGVPEAAPAKTTEDRVFWLLRLLYRSVLERHDSPLPQRPLLPGQIVRSEITKALNGETATAWYDLEEGAGRSLLSVAYPLRLEGHKAGVLLITQSSETYLSLTDRAFSRLLFYSATGLGLAVAALLGYASLLSWRIRRLSRATAQVIGAEGIAAERFPRSNARDEIGDLSRRYGALLDQLQDYHDYLRSLSRTLSHELRTPIAVIRTSLENLEHSGAHTGADGEYLQRARQGLDSLNQILTAMSEANRLEESLHGNAPQRLNLVPFLEELLAAYRQVYTAHPLGLKCEVASATAEVVPELISQALDKLVDNAASFARPGSEIQISLALTDHGYWQIAVSNTGPLLPPAMQRQIFDPMVSLRERRGESGVNLGLGLHIVRLIADFHGGSVRAENRIENGSETGVTVSITLPPAVNLSPETPAP